MNPIKTHREGAILLVTLDRPKANAIDLETSRIMGKVFADFRDDPELRVAIITGGGEKFFCPGWDLKAAADGDEVDGDYGVGGFGGLQELRDLNKPSHRSSEWNLLWWRVGISAECGYDFGGRSRQLCFARNSLRYSRGCRKCEIAQAHPLSHRDGTIADGPLV